MTEKKSSSTSKKTAATVAATTEKNAPKKAVSTDKADKNVPTMDEILAQNFATDPTLEITLPWAQVKPIYDKVLAAVARNVKQDGFRPGKVPANVAKDLVDKNYLAQEVLRQLAPKFLQDELKKKPELKVFIEPELVIKAVEPDTDWQVVAYLPQKPTIKLPDYKKFLTEEKAKAFAQAQKDQAEIAANAKKEKRAYTIPTDEQLQAQATDRALFALLAQVQPKISSIMVRRSAQREFERLVEQLQKNNLKIEDYLKQSGLDMESISQQWAYSSLQNLQLEFILDALLDAEKITASEEEILAKVKETLPNVTDSAEQKKQLEEQSVRDYMELLTKRKKLADWLLKL